MHAAPRPPTRLEQYGYWRETNWHGSLRSHGHRGRHSIERARTFERDPRRGLRGSESHPRRRIRADAESRRDINRSRVKGSRCQAASHMGRRHGHRDAADFATRERSDRRVERCISRSRAIPLRADAGMQHCIARCKAAFRCKAASDDTGRGFHTTLGDDEGRRRRRGRPSALRRTRARGTRLHGMQQCIGMQHCSAKLQSPSQARVRDGAR